MKEFFGNKYYTAKEASVKYGYSLSWFNHRRIENNGPPYMRMKGKGKIYYEAKELDKWFKDNMVEK